MDMQNVTNLEITEGEVRTIHDSSDNLLWGRLNYDTKYAGDTTQQTYSGKNLCNAAGLTIATGGTGITITANEDGSITINGTSTDRYNNYRVIATDIISGIVGQTATVSVQTSGTGSWNNFGIKTETGSNLLVANNTSNPATGVIPQSSTGKYAFDLYFANNITFNNFNMKLQVEVGSTATSFEQYVGGTASPNPDYPQTVNVVTGKQTVTVSDGINSDVFTVNLGSTELAKIGTYQDYIYKSGDDWYVHKETGFMNLKNTTGWWISGGGQGTNNVYQMANYVGSGVVLTEKEGFSDKFDVVTSWSRVRIPNELLFVGNNVYIRVIGSIATTAAQLETYLASNDVFVYYILATPTDTKITDATLISQLNAIHEWMTRYGYQYGVVGTLPIIIDRTNFEL